MKVLDTLTEIQKLEALTGNEAGIFEFLFISSDPMYEERKGMTSSYYYHRSGDKTTSPTYDKIKTAVDSETIYGHTTDELIAKLIRSKFIDKWTRTYKALTEQYEQLEQNTETITDSGTITDTIAYNSTIVDNGNVGTELKTTNETKDDNSYYGFNSDIPTPTDKQEGKDTEIVTGDKTKNTSDNTRTKGGTDTNTKSLGTTKTKTGRTDSPAELLEKEVEFRNKNLFYDIVFSDIDSIFALAIY